MTFLWSEALWLLSAVPLLSAAYVYVLRHRVKASARYAGMTWYRPSAALMHSVKNRLPACLLLIALIAMVIAIARPIATITLPATFSTVVLALDVSASMRATDVKPTRLGAAQAAARSFVNDQPQGTRIGVVSFAENAAVLQRPTSDKTEVLSALDHLEMQRGTALGKAVMASLKTIFPDEKLIDDPANTVKAIDADIRIRPQLALRYEKGPAQARHFLQRGFIETDFYGLTLDVYGCALNRADADGVDANSSFGSDLRGGSRRHAHDAFAICQQDDRR